MKLPLIFIRLFQCGQTKGDVLDHVLGHKSDSVTNGNRLAIPWLNFITSQFLHQLCVFHWKSISPYWLFSLWNTVWFGNFTSQLDFMYIFMVASPVVIAVKCMLWMCSNWCQVHKAVVEIVHWWLTWLPFPPLLTCSVKPLVDIVTALSAPAYALWGF